MEALNTGQLQKIRDLVTDDFVRLTSATATRPGRLHRDADLRHHRSTSPP